MHRDNIKSIKYLTQDQINRAEEYFKDKEINNQSVSNFLDQD